jgi:2-iminobutanoate/2-iminopropanoate deaminase
MSLNPGIEHIGPPVERAGKVQPISPAVVVEDRLVFVAGQVPMRQGQPAGEDIASQTHYTLDLIEAILQRAGCTLADVVKTTVWLVNAKDYPGFNEAYAERFPAATAPARSTVISGLIAPVLVEIEAVALRRPG